MDPSKKATDSAGPSNSLPKTKDGGRQRPHGSETTSSAKRTKTEARTSTGVAAEFEPDPPAEEKLPFQCTECGRTFLLRKALDGHMRCHPERTWRGINRPTATEAAKPPRPRKPAVKKPSVAGKEPMVNEAAECLILFSDGPPLATKSRGYSSVSLELSMWPIFLLRCALCSKVFKTEEELHVHKFSHPQMAEHPISPGDGGGSSKLLDLNSASPIEDDKGLELKLGMG